MWKSYSVFIVTSFQFEERERKHIKKSWLFFSFQVFEVWWSHGEVRGKRIQDISKVKNLIDPSENVVKKITTKKMATDPRTTLHMTSMNLSVDWLIDWLIDWLMMEGGRSKLESWSATLGAGGRGVMKAAGTQIDR